MRLRQRRREIGRRGSRGGGCGVTEKLRDGFARALGRARHRGRALCAAVKWLRQLRVLARVIHLAHRDRLSMKEQQGYAAPLMGPHHLLAETYNRQL